MFHKLLTDIPILGNKSWGGWLKEVAEDFVEIVVGFEG